MDRRLEYLQTAVKDLRQRQSEDFAFTMECLADMRDDVRRLDGNVKRIDGNVKQLETAVKQLGDSVQQLGDSVQQLGDSVQQLGGHVERLHTGLGRSNEHHNVSLQLMDLLHGVLVAEIQHRDQEMDEIRRRLDSLENPPAA
ncbi:hypothetical protein DYH09_26060 [bacterium CPR1]|nr:hypothetical protein [bacterium CPR1]